ncbi:hypothetical protein FJ364_02795 [Candidatus Dependentiae bacterium]|nr:hypothetical protein [Candidatus Dependentiae bacterium]
MSLERQAPVASVAWYKLADLIARGEREKALSVYRLLAHSFDDKAYALQLEGDVLLALSDDRSKEKYFQAAFLYKDEKRWIDAVSLAEHLLVLYPKDLQLMLFVSYCYAALDMINKVTYYVDLFDKNCKQQGVAIDSFQEEWELIKKLSKQKKWLADLLAKF